jgi:hypothetical protein
MLISRPLQSKTFSHRYLAGVLSLLWFYFNLALAVFTSHYCNSRIILFKVPCRSSIVIAG